jgi:hypothetical protein
MTGIEHYREAEKLLAGQQTARRGSAEDLSVLIEALCHAQLATAAAMALKPPSRARWGKVAGRQEEAR